jgi:hypothetical protein
VRLSTKKPEMLMTRASSMMTKNFAPRDQERRMGIEDIGVAKVFILASPLILTLHCKVDEYGAANYVIHETIRLGV